MYILIHFFLSKYESILLRALLIGLAEAYSMDMLNSIKTLRLPELTLIWT